MTNILLISGIPGAGKTTVARFLAEQLPAAAHLEGDFIHHHFIVSGGMSPEAEPQPEAQRQIRLRRRNVCLLADSFAEAGFVPIVDDVSSRAVYSTSTEIYSVRARSRSSNSRHPSKSSKPETRRATSMYSRSGGTCTASS